jgi:hypothetical protein
MLMCRTPPREGPLGCGRTSACGKGALALAVLAAVAFGKAPLARADDLVEARRHFEEGERRFAAGEWHEAFAAYQAAYDSAPLPDFLFNMGQCERKLGRTDRALALFERFLETNPARDRRLLVDQLVREIRTSEPEPTPPPTRGPENGSGSVTGRPPARGANDEPARGGPSGETRSARSPPEGRPTVGPVTWAVAGSAVALAGAAAFFTVRAEGSADELDGLGSECGRDSVVARCIALERDTKALFVTQNVTWAVAGAVAVAALVLFTIDLATAGDGGSRVAIGVPPSGRGLQLAGGLTW